MALTDTQKTIITIIFIICVGTPFAIAAIVLGVSPTSCDFTDPIGLDTRNWLLGFGIFSLFFLLAHIILQILKYCGMGEKFIQKVTNIIRVPQSLLVFAWFIVGSIILFRSNIPCINVGAPAVILTLVLWMFKAISIAIDIIDILYILCKA